MQCKEVVYAFNLVGNIHRGVAVLNLLCAHSAQERRAIVGNHLLSELELYAIRKYVLPSIRTI